MKPAKPKQVRIPAAQRREVIVRAAGRLFGERGYSGTRLDDVAAAAGVTKPILYRHFDSKKALYLALLARHETDLPRFFEGVAPAATAPESLVRAILEVWLDYVRANSHAWLMLFRDSSGDDEIQAFRARVSRRARQVMAEFIAAGRRDSRGAGGAGRRAPAERPRGHGALVDRPPRRSEVRSDGGGGAADGRDPQRDARLVTSSGAPAIVLRAAPIPSHSAPTGAPLAPNVPAMPGAVHKSDQAGENYGRSDCDWPRSWQPSMAS